MSRQSPNKQPGNFNNAASLPAGTFIESALIPIDNKGNILSREFANVGSFLINPDSYEETHNTGWIGVQIPGQSLPVYQWASGGPRTITFEALVTKDTSYFNKTPRSNIASLGKQALNSVGTIASNFLGAAVPTSQLLGLFSNDSSDKSFDLGITQHLAYYRSLWQPTYTANKVQQSPPLLYLYSGSNFDLKSNETVDTVTVNNSSNVFVLTNLSIKITKQLPNLSPMEAVVSFQLEQYPITSVGKSSVGTTPAVLSNLTNSFKKFSSIV